MNFFQRILGEVAVLVVDRLERGSVHGQKIKQWMNQGAFLLDTVRAEFSLTALVYNLRRAMNILGVGRSSVKGLTNAAQS
jgi:hypothetical protein